MDMKDANDHRNQCLGLLIKVEQALRADYEVSVVEWEAEPDIQLEVEYKGHIYFITFTAADEPMEFEEG